MARVCNVCHRVHDDDDSPACTDCIERGRYARKPRFTIKPRKCVVCTNPTQPGKYFCSRTCELEAQRRTFGGATLAELPRTKETRRMTARARYFADVLKGIKAS